MNRGIVPVPRAHPLSRVPLDENLTKSEELIDAIF